MSYQDTPENKTWESDIARLKRMDERLRRIRGKPKGQPIASQIPRNQGMPTTKIGMHPWTIELSVARRIL